VRTVDPDDIVKLGASLRPIDPSTLKPGRVWFCGGEAYFEVALDVVEGTINWFQFTLRGRSLTWDRRDRTIRTGITNELVVPDVSYYPASKTLAQDDQQDDQFLDLVKAILRTRPDQPLLRSMLDLLNSGHPSP
jgi:hypothetical protein